MKIRLSILWLCAILILLIITSVWFSRKPVVTPDGRPTTPKSAESVKTPNPPVHSTPALASNEQAVTLPQRTNDLHDPDREELLRDFAAKNDVPIVFYGKVEDQFGTPLTETTVDFNVHFNNGTEAGIKKGNVVTDANGLFTVSGYTGERLSVIPKKAGYALASLNGGGTYSLMYREEERIHPDPNNPVAIKMWKLQGEEPLVNISHTYKIPYTDKPIYFDLIARTTVPEGGDIKVIVNRPPGIVSTRVRQDWSVQVQAVDGGLMDSTGNWEITYFAPETGYEASKTFIFSTNSPYSWSWACNSGFFVKSRNGQVYSKLNFGFGINEKPEDPIVFEFRGIANTNGSRNWEGDPDTQKALGR